jgi:hypothetical protein
VCKYPYRLGDHSEYERHHQLFAHLSYRGYLGHCGLHVVDEVRSLNTKQTLSNHHTICYLLTKLHSPTHSTFSSQQIRYHHQVGTLSICRSQFHLRGAVASGHCCWTPEVAIHARRVRNIISQLLHIRAQVYDVLLLLDTSSDQYSCYP